MEGKSCRECEEDDGIDPTCPDGSCGVFESSVLTGQLVGRWVNNSEFESTPVWQGHGFVVLT